MPTTSADNPYAPPAETPDQSGEVESPASFWDRVWATLLDMVIMIPAIAASWWCEKASWAWPGLIIYLVFSLYKPVFEGVFGWTPGKRLLRMRVADRHGQPIGLGRSLARNAIYWADAPRYLIVHGLAAAGIIASDRFARHEEWISLILNGLLLVSVLIVWFRRDRRALHDLWAGTCCLRRAKPAMVLMKLPKR